MAKEISPYDFGGDMLSYVRHYGIGTKKNSNKTVQVNIRMSETLIEDIDLICDCIRVDRADWIRVRLAEIAAYEIQNRRTVKKISVSNRFIFGLINEKKFEDIVGFKPPKEILDKKKHHEEVARRGTEETKKHFKKMLKLDEQEI